MDWVNILNQVFQLCIVPLLGLATSVFVFWIKQKMNEGKTKTKTDAAYNALVVLENIITSCVMATNQTYVDALKEKNAFDAEAQKQALELTYNAVIATASNELKDNLGVFVGDLETFIREKIEQKVLEVK